MACVDLLEALQLAEVEARRAGAAFAIYDRRGVYVVEALIARTGAELEIVSP